MNSESKPEKKRGKRKEWDSLRNPQIIVANASYEDESHSKG